MCHSPLKNILLRLSVGLFSILSLISSTLYAACDISDTAKKDAWKACEGKDIKVTGPRALMEDVPEEYAQSDPSLSGGAGFQDYMTFDEDESYVILRTKTSVECPDEMEVEGALKYSDIGGEKVRIIEVSKLSCK